MKPFDEGVSLLLDSLVQAEISDHVYVSELVLIIDGDLTPLRYELDFFPLPSYLIFISNRKSKHQIFYIALVGAHHCQLFEELWVEGPQVIQRVLLSYQATQEEVRKSRLQGYSLIHGLAEKSPKE